MDELQRLLENLIHVRDSNSEHEFMRRFTLTMLNILDEICETLTDARDIHDLNEFYGLFYADISRIATNLELYQAVLEM